MGFITLQPGDRVADYTTRIAPATLKAQGIKAVGRYLWDGWKGMPASEMHELAAAGVAIYGLCESSATRAATSGAPGGAWDATMYVDLAKRVGFHGTLIWTCDTNITSANVGVVMAYGRAFKTKANALGWGCEVGIPTVGGYIDQDGAAAMASDDEFEPVWLPGASSWSTLFGKFFPGPRTHIRQRVGFIPNTDGGFVLRTTRAWLGAAPATLPDHVVIPAPVLQQTLLSRYRFDAEVQKLQQAGNFWGAAVVPHFSTGPADGKFGPVTTAGLKGFQRWLGVKEDGIYGQVTADAYAQRVAILTALKK